MLLWTEAGQGYGCWASGRVGWLGWAWQVACLGARFGLPLNWKAGGRSFAKTKFLLLSIRICCCGGRSFAKTKFLLLVNSQLLLWAGVGWGKA